MCFCVTRIFCVCLLVGLLKCGCCADKHNHNAEKFNSVNITDELIFLKHIFLKYGTNGTMDFESFQMLLRNIGLVNNFTSPKLYHEHDHNHEDKEEIDHDSINSNLSKPLPHESNNRESTSNYDSHGKEMVNFLNHFALDDLNQTINVDPKNKCHSATEAIYNQKLSEHKLPLTSENFLLICPAIIFDLDRTNCALRKDIDFVKDKDSVAEVWLFAIGAVIIISLCGLCSVAMVPLIQRVFYQSVLQFLVGLAIGSLSGDSLLHLLPHAMAGLNHHDHQGTSSHGNGHGDHSETESHMWRGLVALTGIYAFYLAERLLTKFSNCYRKAPSERKDSLPRSSVRKPEKLPRKSPVMRKLDPEQSRTVGEKLSHHKQGSYGFSFDQLEMEDMQKLNEATKEDNIKSEYRSASESDILADKDGDAIEEIPTKAFSTSRIGKSTKSDDCGANETLVTKRNGQEHSPMMIAVHGNVAGGSASSLQHFHHSHHHHHHHHHSHLATPGNGTISSVAWMVIMGDGLHNFCDGLAIGAAFAAGISSGISTTIAVFCHELPHELGDFAMLIKAGMSVKQALIYNGLSSILCFVGMMVGVLLGNVGSATLWVFAGAAGMFLYIALVDMLPELNTQDGENGISHLLLQALGIISGISIMLVIAIYEHDLRHLLS